jgi:hypothetical protein
MCLINEILDHLEHDKKLEFWVGKAKVEHWEDLSSELYNYFIEENDPRDFNIFANVTHSIFIHGLQCIDWEQLCDLLKDKG